MFKWLNWHNRYRKQLVAIKFIRQEIILKFNNNTNILTK